MIGRSLPEPGAVKMANRKDEALGDYMLSGFLIRNTAEKEELPAVMLQGKKPCETPREFVVWIDRQGKASLFDQDGLPIAPVRKLLDSGFAVVGVDLFGQGEFTKDGQPIAKARLNKSGWDNWGKYAGYTFGYNHSVFAKRVHDILSTIALLRDTEPSPKQIDLVGFAGAGHWVAAACAQAGSAVNRTIIDTDGFRFGQLEAINDPDFLPGGAKYLDLPGIVALCAPGQVWLAGEGPNPEVPMKAYKAAGQAESLRVFSGEGTLDAGTEWLLSD
jgi:hypothetical protein